MSSTGTSIGIIEKHVRPQWSRFDHLVSPVGLDAKRWFETCLLAVEKNPRLLEHSVQEHLRFINTSATLGLEPDGALGQMFAIPFGGKRPCIQPVTGYKGMNTTAGRAGIMIHGDVLREGDEFEPQGGAGDPFRVKLRFGDRQSAPVIGAWAQGQLPNGSFTTPVIMDLSELLAIKKKSPGAKKSDSPWNDFDGPGFAAMCSKTPKRRLQRHLPALLTMGLERMNISQHHLGAVVDTTHEEMGLRSYIDENATVVQGAALTDDADPAKPPSAHPFRIERREGTPRNCANIEEWTETLIRGIESAPGFHAIDNTMEINETVFAELTTAGFGNHVEGVRDAAAMKRTKLKKPG